MKRSTATRMSGIRCLLVSGLILASGIPQQVEAAPDPAPVLGYRIVASYPHDPSAFTQGLIFIDGTLYEGTGQYGRSALRRVDLATGRVEHEIRLAPNLFGEGITYWRGRLVQLTWREQLGLIHDANTLERLEIFHYPGEGWGLTHDGRHWIMSDGSDTLRFLDPATRHVVRRLRVHNATHPVRWLNELEYIDGAIWANVWRSDQLVRIDPGTGRVTAMVDLTALYPVSERTGPEAVLNGIAHDAATDRLFVTGKYWPRLYALALQEPISAHSLGDGGRRLANRGDHRP